MQIHNSPFIQVNDRPVQEAWLNGVRVWPYRLEPHFMALTIDTSKPQDPTDRFYIPIPTGNTGAGAYNYNFIVDWGNGVLEPISWTDPGGGIEGVHNFTHTYPVSNQVFNVYLSASAFPRMVIDNDPVIKDKVIRVAISDNNPITFMNGMFKGCTNLVSVSAYDFPNTKGFYQAFYSCSSLMEFPAIKATVVGSFNSTWENCTNLKTFHGLSAAGATLMQNTWRNCVSLTSFPAIYTPKITNCSNAWNNCSSLSAFPNISLPECTSFIDTWNSCTSLTDFPAINCPAAIDFRRAWQGCTSLTGFEFNENTFSKMRFGNQCFGGVTLPTHTWSSILTSIAATTVAPDPVAFSGGNSKRNAAGTAAYNYLTTSIAGGGRGWSIDDGGPE